MTSKRFTLNVDDLKRVAQNALIFAAPALIVFLTTLQSGRSFEEASVALYTWGLNTLVDLLRKFVANGGGSR